MSKLSLNYSTSNNQLIDSKLNSMNNNEFYNDLNNFPTRDINNHKIKSNNNSNNNLFSIITGKIDYDQIGLNENYNNLYL